MSALYARKAQRNEQYSEGWRTPLPTVQHMKYLDICRPTECSSIIHWRLFIRKRIRGRKQSLGRVTKQSEGVKKLDFLRSQSKGKSKSNGLSSMTMK